MCQGPQGEERPSSALENKKFPFARVARYLAIGLEIPGTIIGALIVGYLIDLQAGTYPWVTVVMAVLGFVGAVYRLVKYLKYFAAEKNES